MTMSNSIYLPIELNEGTKTIGNFEKEKLVNSKYYNTFKNRHGQIIPKTAIIKNDIEIIDWTKTMFPWSYDNHKNNIIETDEYLVIAFSASHSGIIYTNIYTTNRDFIEKFGPRFVKDFTDNESLKKYVRWAYKLPKSIVNSNNKIKHYETLESKNQNILFRKSLLRAICISRY